MEEITWPQTVLHIPFESTRVGVGNGEERLAMILEGIIQGPSVPYDIVDKNGKRWEIKEPVSREIRPGVDGISAISDARSKIENILKKVNDVFIDKKFTLASKAINDALNESELGFIHEFCNVDSPMIYKGEVSIGRINRLTKILEMIGTIVNKVDMNNKHMSLTLVNNELKFEMPVNIKTYINIAEQLNLDMKQVNVNPFEVIASTFYEHAFVNSNEFIDSIWNKSIKASVVFNNVSGVILVNKKGYRIINKENLDDTLIFTRVSQGKPRFKVK